MSRAVLGIGEAAAAAGVSEDTLRYYEREGLLGPIARDASGRRRYEESDLVWIGLVTCFRDAGLGIADLREFTRILRTPSELTERVAFLRQRRDDLAARRDALSTAIAVLDEKIDHYST